MKTSIHPQYYPEAQVICACGNRFTVGSTLPEIHVEICSNCHPFFTGQMRYVDTAGRVDKFKAKTLSSKAAAKMDRMPKKERRAIKRKEKIEQELSRPTSLEDLRSK